MLCALPNRGILRLTGEDLAGFLQGIITNDVHLLEHDAVLYAALLTAQGKYLHDFLLLKAGNDILLDCEALRRQDLQKRLTLYKLRRPITITDVSETYRVYAQWGDNPEPVTLPEGTVSVTDPRHSALGQRLYCPSEISLAESATHEAYEQLRLQYFIPDGSRDMLPEGTFPLENGLEALHGVSFRKGCYVGQEVTARSRHRGTLKKCLARIESSTPLPAPGTPLLSTRGQAVGEMRSSCGNAGLALVKIDAISDAGLTVDGQPVSVTLPSWANPASAA